MVDQVMDYSIKRTELLDVSYVGHVIFFTLAKEKAQKIFVDLINVPTLIINS
jgi:hypothetical protein